MSNRKDITGQRFGKLVALNFFEIKKAETMWNCQCDCGNTHISSYRNLKGGNCQSCGCKLGETQTINIKGQKYGRLLVLNFIEIKKHKAYWSCLCECGNIKNISGTSLINGKTQSCSCLQKERFLESIITHNLCDTVEYNTWQGIKSRCNNKNNPWYGGKGIKVCDKWVNSFENFLEDMGLRPSDKHSIDRIDSNKDYSPENCKWSTDLEQNNNRRSNVKILNTETDEIYSSITEAARAINMKSNTLTSKLIGVVKNNTKLQRIY